MWIFRDRLKAIDQTYVSGQYKMTILTMSNDTHVTDVRGFVHKTTNLVYVLNASGLKDDWPMIALSN